MAALGWRVFPVRAPGPDGRCSCDRVDCQNAGKHPHVPDWPTQATTDQAQIRQWWSQWPGANVGVATGWGSGLVVLDADSPAAIADVESRGMPATTSAMTSKGRHWYLRYPDGLEVRNFTGRLPGVDLRGEGGYVVVPPSRHASGVNYEWLTPPSEVKPAEAPAWLLELAKPQPGKHREGGRNDYLFRSGRVLRQAGRSSEQVLLDLRRLNAEACEPPLAEDEVRQVAENACRAEYETGPEFSVYLSAGDLGDPDLFEPLLRSAPLTDGGNAECIAAFFGDRLRYAEDRDQWYRFNGAYWEPVSDKYMLSVAQYTARARGMASVFVPDKDDGRRLHDHARKSDNLSKLTGAVVMASTMRPFMLNTSKLVPRRDLVAFPNGTLNVETGEFGPAQPGDFITRCVAVDYNPGAPRDRWEQFVLDVSNGGADQAAYLKRSVGYSITGYTSEQVGFFLWGTGANGKSTFLATLQAVLGSLAATTPWSAFDQDLKSGTGEELAGLPGVKFVSVSEVDEGRRLAEARLKQVTGGSDPISCRKLYGQRFEFLPEFKLWIALNHKPTIRNTDEGIWRRVHLIPFTRRFAEGERRLGYETELLKEAEGIAAWAVEGALEWMRIGLAPPESVRNATKEYRADSDILAEFLYECVADAPDPHHVEPHKTFWKVYSVWVKDNGYGRAYHTKTLAKLLVERGWQATDQRGTKRWVGKVLTTEGRKLLKRAQFGLEVDVVADGFSPIQAAAFE